MRFHSKENTTHSDRVATGYGSARRSKSQR
jgi:hypothetical protein